MISIDEGGSDVERKPNYQYRDGDCRKNVVEFRRMRESSRFFVELVEAK